jgi:hypothetical protein
MAKPDSTDFARLVADRATRAKSDPRQGCFPSRPLAAHAGTVSCAVTATPTQNVDKRLKLWLPSVNCRGLARDREGHGKTEGDLQRDREIALASGSGGTAPLEVRESGLLPGPSGMISHATRAATQMPGRAAEACHRNFCHDSHQPAAANWLIILRKNAKGHLAERDACDGQVCSR